MSMNRSVETSWRMRSIGNNGAKSSGPAGSSVPGCSAGGGGLGRSGTRLYHVVGISDSSRTNLCWRTDSSMARPSLKVAGPTLTGSTLSSVQPVDTRRRSEPGRGDDGPIETGLRHPAVVGRIPVVEDGTGGGGDPVTPAVGCREDSGRRVEPVEVGRRGRAEVGGVAVGEDPAVAQEDPVAVPVRAGDRRSDSAMTRTAEVRRVTEGIGVPRGGDHPVTAAAVVRYHRDRSTRTAADAGAGAGEMRVTEGKDSAVGGHHEVAAIISRRHHAHDRVIEALRLART